MLILVSCVDKNFTNQNQNQNQVDNDDTSTVKEDNISKAIEEADKPEPKEPEYYSATISAIGDILAHSPVYKEAYIGNNQYDFSKCLQK